MTILVTLAGPAQTSVGLGAVGPLLVIMPPKMKRKATPLVCDEDDFALLSSNAVAPSWAPTVARQTSRRPKRMKSDDVELLYSRRNVPAGPTTVRELFQWPATVLEQIATRPGCKDRMLRNMVNGVLNTTDYSGVDCPREICYQLGAAMQKIWNIHPSMRFLRSCDNGVIQQKVLTWISNELDGGKSCVFSELESVLDTATKEVWDAMDSTEEHRSSKDPDVREATVAAYQDIKAVLYQNRKRLFKEHRGGLLHPAPGLSLPAFARRLQRQNETASQLEWDHMRRLVSSWASEGARGRQREGPSRVDSAACGLGRRGQGGRLLPGVHGPIPGRGALGQLARRHP